MDSLLKVIKYRKILHENKMWDIVFDLGWGIKSNNHKLIRKYLVDNYTEKEISQLEVFCKSKRKHLKLHLDEYEKLTGSKNYYNVSDDGFWDLTAHIVGLGKERYLSIIKNPDIARDISLNYMYHENFEYIFNK